jgi:SAM-dependent methyltransferase
MGQPSESFLDRIVSLGLYKSSRNLRQYLDNHLAGVSLDGRHVLDIGAGKGLLTFAAIDRGAASVTVLEPELDGATQGITKRLERSAEALGFSNRVTLVRETIQDYRGGDRRFDVVLSAASINHWDETACMELRTSDAARERYMAIFRKIRGLIRDGGDLVFSDVGRRNVFGDLGLRNPLSPHINWRKHLEPDEWAALLERAGFRDPRICWTTFHSLGRVGTRLLDHRAVAYLTNGAFVVRMRASTSDRAQG